MPAAFEPPLSARLRDAEHVLIAGAGGGFDVYAGLPLALALRNAGTRVTLAGYAVSELGALSPSSWVRAGLAAVRPDSAGNDRYFPERTLARWLAAQGAAAARTHPHPGRGRPGHRGVPRRPGPPPGAPPHPALTGGTGIGPGPLTWSGRLRVRPSRGFGTAGPGSASRDLDLKHA